MSVETLSDIRTLGSVVVAMSGRRAFEDVVSFLRITGRHRMEPTQKGEEMVFWILSSPLGLYLPDILMYGV